MPANLIAGLDIGTTKTCAVIAEVEGDARDPVVKILGVGQSRTSGLRRDVVTDIEETTASVNSAMKEAELMAGAAVEQVLVGLAGEHIRASTSTGVVAVGGEEVSKADVQRVHEVARAVVVPQSRELLHVLPQEYILDHQAGIRDPIGMAGTRLEAEVYIITSAAAACQNLRKAVSRAGYRVAAFVHEPLASALAVLSEDERELGVGLLDVGGGTTDVAVFSEGGVKHTAVIAMGGNQITKDIGFGVRTPDVEAERLKKKHGCALTGLVKRDEAVEVPSVGGRPPRVLSRQILAEIVQPRVEEIYHLAAREIVKSGFEDVLASGLVITGGATIMDGMAELAEQTFNLPIRRGYPRGIGGLVDVVNSPMYATGVGLVLYGLKHQHEPGDSLRPRSDRGKDGKERHFQDEHERTDTRYAEYAVFVDDGSVKHRRLYQVQEDHERGRKT
jgi:cell division protein FtsA